LEATDATIALRPAMRCGHDDFDGLFGRCDEIATSETGPLVVVIAGDGD
jgi:hypothetical protein